MSRSAANLSEACGSPHLAFITRFAAGGIAERNLILMSNHFIYTVLLTELDKL